MKIKYSILGLILTGFIFIGCDIDKAHKQSSSVMEASMASIDQQDEIEGKYGAEITIEGAIPASQVLAQLGDKELVELKVEGTIVEVCQMKGCWMTMDIGSGETMRITFKDYEFFVPKASAGYKAVIEGKLTRQMTDVETLQHYAEDAGKTKEEVAEITEPEEKLSFEAAGVIITGTAD